MDIIIAPGFKELFGNIGKPYDEWLKDIPSESIIVLMSALNNELNTKEDDKNTQGRLLEIVTEGFTKQQLVLLEQTFLKYRNSNPAFEGLTFRRRYLLAMVTKELKRNKVLKNSNITPDQGFYILMAYLHVVDELNDEDQIAIKAISENNDEFGQYITLWLSFIDQYELNDEVNGAFELIKLLCICKYCYDNLRSYLKEYLSKFNFPNLSQFFASNSQLLKAGLTYQPNKLFKRLNFIAPEPHTNTKHLNHQSINQIIGNPTLTFSHIRKFPLYETSNKDFMKIDEDFFRKKIYRGPFFEIFYETSLQQTKSFNQYSQDISKGTMEEICFRAICTLLAKSNCDILHFDDNTQSQPDAFFRLNDDVIMIEFKDYIFKESFFTRANIQEVRPYIDGKFVKSDKGQPKGITQLANQIELLLKNKYSFDAVLNQNLKAGKKIIIYPVICYSDFMFSMPGVNDYLNKLFEKMTTSRSSDISIAPVTMISIETLFDYCYKNGSFILLTKLIDRYWDILRREKQKLSLQYSTHQFIQTMTGFDEMYRVGNFKEYIGSYQPNIHTELTKLIGLTQEQIDEYL